ncbi:MAG: 2-C-methyl-D-erythritol 2,4-cyclodiphosphate synthase [Dehalococcoidales bacterium]|nr:2-C-methyl-D-erythritol 2,4-cyclodiphosphate synthase [Dehalococcoidales bacterium]
MSDNLRIGMGYDAHPLIKGRKLVLGGVDIRFDQGLDGWSDADVLVHAVMDALLGAAALGDIGRHFPPGAVEYKDISSLVLLAEVAVSLLESGYEVVNIDATVVAAKPQLSKYIEDMRKNLSNVLAIDLNQVSVKASSNNKLGDIGQGKGMAAYAVALIKKGEE